MVTNTRERAISTDLNRSEAFANADRAEMLRWLLDVRQGSDDFGIGGQSGRTVVTYPPARPPRYAEAL